MADRARISPLPKRGGPRAAAIACVFVVAAIALAVPLWLLRPADDAGQGNSPEAPQLPTADFAMVNGEIVEADSEALPAGVGDGERDASQLAAVGVIADDGITAEHEAGVVLAKLPANVSPDDFNARLANLDFLASREVSADDIALGWVELTVADGVSVPDALAQLSASGVVAGAQPNYVYRLLDDDLQPGASDRLSFDVPTPSPEGDDENTSTESYDVRYYDDFLNDPLIDNQMMLITVKLREAYEYLREKGYVVDTGYKMNPDGSTLTPATAGDHALTWLKPLDESGTVVERPAVAILDTGCAVEHRDLAANIIDYYDAVEEKGKDDGVVLEDIEGHGTHVAGIVSAVMNNGVGVTGMSFNAKLVPVNVFKKTGGEVLADSLDILKGYRYVMDRAAVDNIRVVNLSLGSETETPDKEDKALIEGIEQAYRKGILTVIASGNSVSFNDPQAYSDYPSDFTPNAIGVIDCTVVDVNPKTGRLETTPENRLRYVISMARSYYSNFNKEGAVREQLSALGSGVKSTLRSGSYGDKSGTSMASPCVAGIAALVVSVNPGLSVDELRSVLYSSADDVAAYPEGRTPADAVTEGFDLYTGFGTVNAYRAVKAADAGAYLSAGGDSLVLCPGDAVDLQVADTGASGIVWRSADMEVAAIDDAGHVVAQGPGQAYVSASYGEGESAETLYQVVTVYSASIADPGSLTVGEAKQLVLDASPAGGTWRWTSDNAAVSVDEWSGEVRGDSFGVSANITAALVANPEVRVTRAVTVGKISLADAAVSLSPTSYTYDGKAHEPAVTVTLGGKTLAKDKDFTVGYRNNVAVGTATVTVTGAGNYVGEKSATFEIKAAPTPSGGSSGSSSGASQGGSGNASSGSSGSGSGGAAVATQKMHRLYNPNSGEHFYTANEQEYQSVKAAGWTDEGWGWTAPAKSNTPVYRLYNANGGEHHYTPDKAERDALVNAGWKDEGIGWYSDDKKTVPLYREYNPNAFANNHNYTTNLDEHKYLVSIGWQDEGKAWYGV